MVGFKPTGFIACLPAICSTTAFVLAILSNFYCQTVDVDATIAGVDTTFSFGFWNYRGWAYAVDGNNIYYKSVCYGYPNGISLDAKWKTAQAFSIISIVLGACLMLWNWIAPCFNKGMTTYMVAALVYLICTLSQGLTLLFLQSDACTNNPMVGVAADNQTYTSSECKLAWGGKCGFSATIFWFVAAISVCAAGKMGLNYGCQDETDVEQQELDDANAAADLEADKAAEKPEEAVEPAAETN